ncbi:hypothetical protein HPT25_28070 [Bacillus sp. BRMEA1]|uniref:hypothetical protein n=1 Tax=Neobacillus endophyticus TaxID=2738405 RepID=UPI0015674287|nr:hypothetical protein [Neobacillus endophyticus]NRD81152.1 hypothetical protein [Neobacillus endophyticus]
MESPKISGGYIILSRKIIESEIWEKPPLYIKVWIYLLTKAQHAEFKKLKRGQLFTSIPEIMEACSWKVGYRTVKPTKDQIFQVIDWLRKGNESSHEGETKATMITTTKATQGLLINIDNYDHYQTPKNYESNEEGNDEEEAKATRKQRQPDNINKNDKNVKNDKNENKNNIPLEIENFRLRYSKNQLKIIDDYLEMIRHTRVSAKVSNSVILGMYKEWDKHPPICVEYGLKTHTENPAYHSKKENYTLGIIRNTPADEAAKKLVGVSKQHTQIDFTELAEEAGNG